MIERIAAAIAEAETSRRLIDVPNLDGFSGDCLIGCLQRLASLNRDSDRCYVEVGVFRGLTLISVGCANRTTAAFGIDNFSQVDSEKRNRHVVDSHIAAHGLQNVTLIDADFEDALSRLDEYLGGRRVGTYFVDGPHDYRSQLMCLELIRPHLSQSAAIVVDDSNYLHVRQANRDFLTIHREFKLMYEAYTSAHPCNMNQRELTEARQGWWDGVNIIVHDPDEHLEPMFPTVESDRRIFLNDHIVHSSRLAANSNRAVEVLTNFMGWRPFSTARSLAKLWHERSRVPGRLRGEFTSANTFSRDLQNRRMNPSLSRLHK